MEKQVRWYGDRQCEEAECFIGKQKAEKTSGRASAGQYRIEGHPGEKVVEPRDKRPLAANGLGSWAGQNDGMLPDGAGSLDLSLQRQ